MTPPAVAVRPAIATDRASVVALFLACWRISYAGVLPAAVVSRYDEDSAAALWAARFKPAVDPALVVAEIDGAIGGFAVIRIEPDAGYLASLYAHPDHQGVGIGGRLFAEAIGRTAAGRRRRLRWWVFATNQPAIDFYLRRGGRPTGRTRIEPEYGVDEVEMARGVGHAG